MFNKTRQRHKDEQSQQPPEHQESWQFRAVRAVAGHLGKAVGWAIEWGVGRALTPHVQMAAAGLLMHGHHLPYLPGVGS